VLLMRNSGNGSSRLYCHLSPPFRVSTVTTGPHTAGEIGRNLSPERCQSVVRTFSLFCQRLCGEQSRIAGDNVTFSKAFVEVNNLVRRRRSDFYQG
jgi:hypothetical protein